MTLIPTRLRTLFNALLCSASLLAAHAASGATFEVTPVLLEMQGAQRVTSFTVVNREDRPTTIQVRGLLWQQEENRDALTPTQDLQVSPPIFTLGPNESQLVRVFARKIPPAAPAAAADEGERSYRVLIDEIPSPGDQSAVHMALRISIPLFVYTGRAGTPTLEWKLVNEPESGPWIAVTNKGSRRTKLFSLTAADQNGKRLEVAAAKSAYVLPGAQRAWRLDGWSNSAQPVGAVTVSGQTDSGEISAQASRLSSR